MALQTMYPGQVNSPITELASAIGASDTAFAVIDGGQLPDAPNIVVIGSGETAETILYGGKSGNNLTTVTRGFQGTAKAWGAGIKVARFFTAYDYDALRENVEEIGGLVKRKVSGTFPLVSGSEWVRVAEIEYVSSGLAANVYGLFLLSFKDADYNSTVLFAVSRSDSTQPITHIIHSSKTLKNYTGTGILLNIRAIYKNTSSAGDKIFVELQFQDGTTSGNEYELTLFEQHSGSGFSWDLNTPVMGSVPSGYSVNNNFQIESLHSGGWTGIRQKYLGRLQGSMFFVESIYIQRNPALTGDFNTNYPNITISIGSPEGSLIGVPGSIALRTDGGAGTSIYVKESGTGNTGWVAK